MNTFIVVFALLVVSYVQKYKKVTPLYGFRHTPPQPADAEGGESWGEHTTRVDHFNLANSNTFKQRYLCNLDNAKDDDPPIIIYVGGEWEIKEGQLTSGQLHLMAQENEAALYYLEHRFYGKSMPKKDYSTKHLKLLTSDQAMKDLASFIDMIKEEDQFANSKVVLFGCSYSATLTTWMKHDYDDMITAVYATSGPLQAKEDMHEYLEKATVVLNLLDSECVTIIEQGIQGLQDLYEKDKDGPKKVRKLLRYCTPKPNEEPYDKMVIFETIAASFGNAVQTSLPTAQQEGQKLRSMSGETNFDKFVNYQRANVSEHECIHYDYTSTLSAYKDTKPGSSLRPFFYQQCTTFGWFVTTNSDDQIFGDVVQTDFYHKLCGDSFDNTVNAETIAEAVKATNERYGGNHPTINNTVFAYGGLDPWQAMGVQSNYSDDSAVFYIGSGGHCWDMFQPLTSDGDDMAQAKIDIRAHIKKYLEEAD